MSEKWLPYDQYQAKQRNELLGGLAIVGAAVLMSTRKAPPMFWTWPRYAGFFALVICLPAGVLGMLLTLAISGQDPSIMDIGVVPALAVSFANGVFLASVPTLMVATVVWLSALPVRRLRAEYRQAGWKAKDCRAIYRRALASGSDYLPPPHAVRSTV